MEQIQFTNDSTLVMTTTKEYDYVNRLAAIESSSSSFSSSSSYQYNNANQRTSVTNADGSYWTYTYDDLGQVISGKKRWSDGSLVAGQQFEYGFDDIGNRGFSKAGGDQNGANLRTTPYQQNLLNQYDLRVVPPQVSVLGEADPDATVTVNLAATERKGPYWWGEAVATNNNGPVWLAITNIAVLADDPNPHVVATNVGRVRVPQATETFTYDWDGNLTSDSLWTNVWNGENRRTLIESRPNLPAAAKARVQWTHLPDGRWIERIVSTWNTNTLNYQPSTTNRFVWDGNVLLAVLDADNALELAFMRGLDLSGTMHGGGGVGGVLAVRSAELGTRNFASYDGNGNVVALVDAATGEESARYEYGPFGELLRMTGPVAGLNPIRFSTQYADDVTGDLKYKYRDYQPSSGRWPNRDPIGERGGLNLYGFVGNNAVNLFEYLGLKKFKNCKEAKTRDGRPRIVFTTSKYSGGGWNIVDIDPKLKAGTSQARAIQQVVVHWEADVTVMCICRGCTTMQTGTRVAKVPHETTLLTWQSSALPTGVPAVTEVARGISELVAANLEEKLGEYSTMTRADSMEFSNIIQEGKPTEAYEGKWKNGKSPCDSLN